MLAREKKKAALRESQQRLRDRRKADPEAAAAFSAQEKERKSQSKLKRQLEVEGLQAQVKELNVHVAKLKQEVNAAKMAGEERCKRILKEKRKRNGEDPWSDSDDDRAAHELFKSGFSKVKNYLDESKFTFSTDEDDHVQIVRQEKPRRGWKPRARAYDRKAEKYVAKLEQRGREKEAKIEELKNDIAKRDSEILNCQRALRLKELRIRTVKAETPSPDMRQAVLPKSKPRN